MSNPRPGGPDPATPNSLQFANVAPGHYHLIAQSFGPGSCLDSVLFGGNDVRRNGVEVAAGGISAPLDVTLRTDCASVEVKVNASAGDKPVSILLLPDDPVLDVPVMNSSANNELAFPSLPPGGYRLYAFDTIDQLEYSDPEVMKQFTAQELTLTPNQKAQVTLPLISRSGGDRSTADAAQ
jgi:hypothetical protein